jgi:dUTP pyrophosphatase
MSYRMIHTIRRLMCDKFSVLCTLAELNEREELRMKVNVRIKRLNEDAVIPKYAHDGDACFDLVAVEDVIIEPGQTKKIPTGWAMQTPPDYWIDIRPRSGISEKTKLRISNSPGTIDAYTGEIGVLMDNIAQPEYDIDLNNRSISLSETTLINQVDGSTYRDDWEDYPQGTYVIRKGDRIAQALVTLKYKAKFTVVDELEPTQRGDKGFGSSGVKTP